MCGIVGYVGREDAVDTLLHGLRRLEYRGYDSAGLAVLPETGRLTILRRAGKVTVLADAAHEAAIGGICGIAHTRWATHGGATEENAHPHRDCTGTIAVVHNGIIENHGALRQVLEREGHTFTSETDTEVIAHLIERFYHPDTDLEEAVSEALNEVSGAYGIAVVSAREPGKIVASRRGSPLVVAQAETGNMVASDAQALPAGAVSILYLKDEEVAVLTAEKIRVLSAARREVTRPEFVELSSEIMAAEKGDFPHYMLKEIYEQPTAIANTLAGRINLKDGVPVLGGLRDVDEQLRKAQRIIIAACGTSWHAGLVAEYLIEELAGIPVEVEYASEFRYRNPPLGGNPLLIVISQSGETADTLAALREARVKGVPVIGVCNVPGSTIARETDAGVFTKAGPEIGVASTKAFTCQVAVLTLIAVLLGRQRGLSLARGTEVLEALSRVPDLIREALGCDGEVRRIAAEFASVRNFLYLGRGVNFPVALEGALKLKEISYIHAEGYPAAEMKHGPIALIDEAMPVAVIAPRDHTREKVLSNMQEVAARKGRIIAIHTHGDTEVARHAHSAIQIPPALDLLTPLVAVVPLQLLAYHAAVMNGRDVDQPRNLAKSVTVE